MSKPAPILRPSISRAIREFGILPDHEIYHDDSYMPITQKWLRGEFLLYAQSFAGSMGWGTNTGEESADCDDLTAAYLLNARNVHHVRGRRGPAIAMGEFAYIREATGIGHSVVIAFERLDGDLLPLFVDPTRRAMFVPTDSERKNCKWVIL